MKKILLSITALLAIGAAHSQNDTLSAHCNSAQLSSGLIDFVAPLDTGFVAGTNAFGDLAKMRLFDPTHEVTSNGTITGVAFQSLMKVDMGGSIAVAIWSDNNGQPNLVPIGLKMVTLASIDTALSATMVLADGNIYNNIVMFDAPVNIPNGDLFWAGIVLPDASNGNWFAMPISVTQDGSNAVYTGEFWDNSSFHTFGDPSNWGVDASIPVYPIVNFSGVATAGLEENNLSVSVYPNPTNSILNVKTSAEAKNISIISIISMDGKVVVEAAVHGLTGSVDVSALTNGVYFYEVTTANGSVSRNTFVKN